MRQAYQILSHAYAKGHPKLKALQNNITWAEMKGQVQHGFVSPAATFVRESYATAHDKTVSGARAGVEIAKRARERVSEGLKSGDFKRDVAKGVTDAKAKVKDKMGDVKAKLKEAKEAKKKKKSKS